VISDIAFLYSTAGVSMSLASLAGLVIAFRRTGAWGTHDVFRLREIVEWGFANVLLALLAIPAAATLGSEASALRLMGAVALVYITVNVLVLVRRARAMERDMQRVTGTTSQAAALENVVRVRPLVIGINIALAMLATATIVLASVAPWELTLLLLVVRPMTAFVFVLASIGREGDPG
jgi:hypothetical protein